MQEIDTPALLIDLKALERNIKTIGDYYRAKKGAALLPHQKGHRLPIIAKKQIEAGAKGVSITSLGLAEYYVSSGIDNILITAEIVGKSKIRRACSLSKEANITVSVDNIENVHELSLEAVAQNTIMNVAVELYGGRTSAGVQFENVKSFAKDIVKLPGIRLRGLWYHSTNETNINNFDERRKTHFAALERIAAVKDGIEDAGIDVEFVSAGQTCTWNITPECTQLTDVQVQAGSYVFSDWCSHHHVEGIEVFDCALSVLTRCISKPRPNEAIFDFGMNSCSDECGEDYHNVVGPAFKDADGIKGVHLREEIAFAELTDPAAVKVGDIKEVIPAHSDTTAKLHNKYFGIRDGVMETIWPNYGRGLF